MKETLANPDQHRKTLLMILAGSVLVAVVVIATLIILLRARPAPRAGEPTLDQQLSQMRSALVATGADKPLSEAQMQAELDALRKAQPSKQ